MSTGGSGIWRVPAGPGAPPDTRGVGRGMKILALDTATENCSAARTIRSAIVLEPVDASLGVVAVVASMELPPVRLLGGRF